MKNHGLFYLNAKKKQTSIKTNKALDHKIDLLL